jgi:small-conductance mechanosensitive channel
MPERHVEMTDAILQFADEVLAVHPILRAAVVLFAFVLLALLVDRMCRRAVARFLGSGEGEKFDHVVRLMRRPVILTVSSIGVVLALQIVGTGSSVLTIIADVIRTGLVILWATVIYRLFVTISVWSTASRDRPLLSNANAAQLMGNIAAVFLLSITAYAILLIWGINVSAVVASAGILGIALSLAAQDTLSNLFAGLSILADRPYAVGDYIVLDSGDRGEVTDIGLRSTRLRTRDDVGVTIPNGAMARAKIVNEEAGLSNGYRIRLKVGVAYGCDVRRACKVLSDVACRHDEVLELPEPRVRLRQFGESSLDFELLCWIRRPADRGRITHELLCDVYEALAEHGLEIPYPQREITIRKQSAG